jgi:Leucine-rich repeat (LRR) protein
MQLETMPEAVLLRTKLTHLDMSVNRLRELPTGLLRLTRLAELSVDSNLLQKLPDGLSLLTDLQVLSAGGNEGLSELPHSLGSLRRLRVLAVEGCALKELPPELGIAPALEEVRVRGCPLKVPPPEVVRRGSRAVLDYLRRIVDFQRNNICNLSSTALADPELPEYVLRQRSLGTLLLNDNQLEDLHSGLTRLASLTVLDLSNNRFQQLPPPVLHLTTLEILKIAGNDIEVLPDGLAAMHRLRELTLGGNARLRFIPSALGTITTLAVLDVDQCPLRSPPPDVVASCAAAAASGARAPAQTMVDYLGRLHMARDTRELLLEGFDMMSCHEDLLDPQVGKYN